LGGWELIRQTKVNNLAFDADELKQEEHGRHRFLVSPDAFFCFLYFCLFFLGESFNLLPQELAVHWPSVIPTVLRVIVGIVKARAKQNIRDFTCPSPPTNHWRGFSLAPPPAATLILLF
jgi:hypothetical protein